MKSKKFVAKELTDDQLAKVQKDMTKHIAKKVAKKSALKAGNQAAAYNSDSYLDNEKLMGDAEKKAAQEAEKLAAGESSDSFSELAFTTFYGDTPDAMYVNVDGIKRWPSGDSTAISSQVEIPLGVAIPYDPATGFLIELMEYDEGSGDDGLGWAFWNPYSIRQVKDIQNGRDVMPVEKCR